MRAMPQFKARGIVNDKTSKPTRVNPNDWALSKDQSVSTVDVSFELMNVEILGATKPTQNRLKAKPRGKHNQKYRQGRL
jgi:hypothetical protein